jgi:hypothetical protein
MDLVERVTTKKYPNPENTRSHFSSGQSKDQTGESNGLIQLAKSIKIPI